MMLTIHGLPLNVKYQELKILIKQECNISEFILDNLISEEGGTKKVRIGVADESEGALLMRSLDGYSMSGYRIRIQPVGKTPLLNTPRQPTFEPRPEYGHPSIDHTNRSIYPTPTAGPSNYNYPHQHTAVMQQQPKPDPNPYNQREVYMPARQPQPQPQPQEQSYGYPQKGTAPAPSDQRRITLRTVELVEPHRPMGVNKPYIQPTAPTFAPQPQKPMTVFKDNFQGPTQGYNYNQSFNQPIQQPYQSAQDGRQTWPTQEQPKQPNFNKPSTSMYIEEKKFQHQPESGRGLLKTPSTFKDYEQSKYMHGQPARLSPPRRSSPQKRLVSPVKRLVSPQGREIRKHGVSPDRRMSPGGRLRSRSPPHNRRLLLSPPRRSPGRRSWDRTVPMPVRTEYCEDGHRFRNERDTDLSRDVYRHEEDYRRGAMYDDYLTTEDYADSSKSYESFEYHTTSETDTIMKPSTSHGNIKRWQGTNLSGSMRRYLKNLLAQGIPYEEARDICFERSARFRETSPPTKRSLHEDEFSMQSAKKTPKLQKVEPNRQNIKTSLKKIRNTTMQAWESSAPTKRTLPEEEYPMQSAKKAPKLQKVEPTCEDIKTFKKIRNTTMQSWESSAPTKRTLPKEESSMQSAKKAPKLQEVQPICQDIKTSLKKIRDTTMQAWESSAPTKRSLPEDELPIQSAKKTPKLQEVETTGQDIIKTSLKKIRDTTMQAWDSSAPTKCTLPKEKTPMQSAKKTPTKKLQKVRPTCEYTSTSLKKYSTKSGHPPRSARKRRAKLVALGLTFREATVLCRDRKSVKTQIASMKYSLENPTQSARKMPDMRLELAPFCQKISPALNIGIQNKEPMTEEQIELLQSAILKLIIECKDPPRFINTQQNSGNLLLTCENLKTRDWAAKIVSNLKPWPSASLSLLSKTNMPKKRIAIAYFPGPLIMEVDQILKCLSLQNGSLDTSSWRVIRRKVQERGQNLTFALDDKGVKALRAVNFRPCVGMNKVNFKVLGHEELLDQVASFSQAETSTSRVN